MPFYVYILYNLDGDVYYKGYTTDLEKRLAEHNLRLSAYTSRAGAWELVYSKLYLTKREALIEERRIKKLNRAALQRLISAAQT